MDALHCLTERLYVKAVKARRRRWPDFVGEQASRSHGDTSTTNTEAFGPFRTQATRAASQAERASSSVIGGKSPRGASVQPAALGAGALWGEAISGQNSVRKNVVSYQ